MINVFYGIRRLLLLNTASYSLGDFPLDRPLSISARNNRGKSTVINALQFPFLSNMNDMSFPRNNEDTRKYYFPYDNSYVVTEIVTEKGTYVIGAVGKGQASGYSYQLFAYQSKLDNDDFLSGDSDDNDRDVRNYKELVSHLAKRGVWAKSLHPKQMRDALMGKSISLPNDEKFTIGVFRLRSMTDENYRLFIRVFKNLLHMNNVNLGEMKRLLIDVLLPGEGSVSIDFMARYRILNEEVEKAKGNSDTVINIAPAVKKLKDAKESRDEAYGILRSLFSPITIAYETDKEKREKEIQDIARELLSIEPRMLDLKNSQAPLLKSIEEMVIKENGLKEKLKVIENNEVRFALYNSVDELQQQINSKQSESDKLVGELQRTHPEDIKRINSELKRVNQQLKALNARMIAINSNLLFVLTERFGEHQIQTITKLINKDLLSSLPLGEKNILVLNEEKLFEYINQTLLLCKDGFYDDGLIRINLEKLEAINIDDYFNYEKIQEDIEGFHKREEELKRNLEVADDYNGMEKRKNELITLIKKDEKNLEEYKLFLEAKKGVGEIENTLTEMTILLDKTRLELRGVADKHIKLGEEKQTFNTNKTRLELSLLTLENNIKKVEPVPACEPMGVEPTYRLPTGLEEMVDTYLLTLEAKKEARDEIDKQLDIIENKNGLRFTSGQDEDITINELIDAVKGTDIYIQQQEYCQKAVSQEIGALLKGLTDRFDIFEHEISLFNRQMNSRKISNINRIEFVVDGNNDILRAIKDIVDQDSIFNDPERVHRAVKQLDMLITKKNVKLSLESLFNMKIETELQDGKVSSSSNEENIESTGTGLTVKVILNVMLLKRLLFVKEGQVINIPIYIDEAGRIDPDNQQTLIDQCLPVGFVPIFASVEAQATAYYWIGLNEVNGRIYVDQKDWFRLSKIEEISSETVNA